MMATTGKRAVQVLLRLTGMILHGQVQGFGGAMRMTVRCGLVRSTRNRALSFSFGSVSFQKAVVDKAKVLPSGERAPRTPKPIPLISSSLGGPKVLMRLFRI